MPPTQLAFAAVVSLTAGPLTPNWRRLQSEEVESMEIGMRSNPTDNSQLNLTYFMADYSDKQTTIITAGNDPVCGKSNEFVAGVTCSFVRNAGEV